MFLDTRKPKDDTFFVVVTDKKPLHLGRFFFAHRYAWATGGIAKGERLATGMVSAERSLEKHITVPLREKHGINFGGYVVIIAR